VNLKYIDDGHFNNKMHKEINNLENKAKGLIREVLDGIEASLSNNFNHSSLH
jgi:formiminotetrahydrofolate cyclodeaminase